MKAGRRLNCTEVVDSSQDVAEMTRPAVSESQPVVEMRDLTMQWGSRRVLDAVNLEMQPGERLAVVGPSGAGKSTVLRLLAGLQMPTGGELRLFGKPQSYLRLDQDNPPMCGVSEPRPAGVAHGW